MNREDVIRMAREAGFIVDAQSQAMQPNCIFHTWHMVDEGLARFAALVAASEREECAKVAAKMLRYYTQAVTGVPEAIRARGEK